MATSPLVTNLCSQLRSLTTLKGVSHWPFIRKTRDMVLRRKPGTLSYTNCPFLLCLANVPASRLNFKTDHKKPGGTKTCHSHHSLYFILELRFAIAVIEEEVEEEAREERRDSSCIFSSEAFRSMVPQTSVWLKSFKEHQLRVSAPLKFS